MTNSVKVKQMAHLRQKTISDSSCKAIITDTLLDTVRPISQDELADEIANIFHVLVLKERLNSLIDELVNEGILVFDADGHIDISSVKKAEFIISRMNSTNLQKEAFLIWIESLSDHNELSESLKDRLLQALPIFLRTVFIRHGVSSYQLLVSNEEITTFDLNQLATDISGQFEKEYQDAIARFLPTVFQSIRDPKVMAYLKSGVDKAVGYISEVISDENLKALTDSLANLTLYLDTNVIYRLLNLQGKMRYDSIKETLDFCRDNNVKLKVSALTKKELTARLDYDSKVLIKFPTRVDLLRHGYRYRSSDNYVSTYWEQAMRTKVSVNDFIDYYKNFDVILTAEQIETESIFVDEEALIARSKDLFERMALRDPNYEKGDNALWHDAYCFSYVQKMQKTDSKNAVDTGCLFLTTDQALTSFQRDDHELRDSSPVVISPSQLLQLFSFSKPNSGFEETFVKFFASSSVGVTFPYDNDDIQEILSRIAHYEGVSPDIAEKILGRELLNSRYLTASSDEEKEEIIYNDISEELLSAVDVAQRRVAQLEVENAELVDTKEKTLKTIEDNKIQFSIELSRLQAEKLSADEQSKTEKELREKAEKEVQRVQAYNNRQERFFIQSELQKWKRIHLCLFWIAFALFAIIIAISLYFSISNNLGYLALLALLAFPIWLATYGCKGFSKEALSDARIKLTSEYREKMKEE